MSRDDRFAASRSRSPSHSPMDFYRSKSRSYIPTGSYDKTNLRDRSGNTRGESGLIADDRSHASIQNNYINIQKYRDRLRSDSNSADNSEKRKYRRDEYRQHSYNKGAYKRDISQDRTEPAYISRQQSPRTPGDLSADNLMKDLANNGVEGYYKKLGERYR